jgi:hypothetical protein
VEPHTGPILVKPRPKGFTWHKNHWSSFIKYIPYTRRVPSRYPPGIMEKHPKKSLAGISKNVVAKLRLQCLLLSSSLEKKRKKRCQV